MTKAAASSHQRDTEISLPSSFCLKATWMSAPISSDTRTSRAWRKTAISTWKRAKREDKYTYHCNCSFTAVIMVTANQFRKISTLNGMCDFLQMLLNYKCGWICYQHFIFMNLEMHPNHKLYNAGHANWFFEQFLLLCKNHERCHFLYGFSPGKTYLTQLWLYVQWLVLYQSAMGTC